MKKFLLLLLITTGVHAEETPARFCKPDQACWPTAAEWKDLAAHLSGKLERPESPVAACAKDVDSPGCAAALASLKNPFALQDQIGGTQTLAWIGAWTATPSAYAVVVKNPADVVAAVGFARRHHLRLVVKGTGHDYLGRSTAADALLVWTHELRGVTMHDAFVPAGCDQARAAPAVSVLAGTRWLEAYQEVTVKHGRYVQGGGCTTVGAAGGFLQGGGFGSWSKKYGTAAANLLEAEVVTGEGQLVVANACQNQDLYWALRGGGGGTFGVVVRATLRTDELPKTFGVVFGKVTAKSDAAYQELIEETLRFYRQSLADDRWGEKMAIKGDGTIEIGMVFQGLAADEAEKIWLPYRRWVEKRADRYAIELHAAAFPATKMWDQEFLTAHGASLGRDPRPDHAGQWWWGDNQGEVAVVLYAYQSRWLPQALLGEKKLKALAATLFQASRHFALELHFNKGQAGAAPDAVARGRETAMNPAVFDAAALIIVATGGSFVPGVKGHEPDPAVVEKERKRVGEAMQLVRAATPGAGSYLNETDYFEPDWKQSFWGPNYPRLLEIKHRYDPDGVFFCHHCVGSDE